MRGNNFQRKKHTGFPNISGIQPHRIVRTLRKLSLLITTGRKLNLTMVSRMIGKRGMLFASLRRLSASRTSAETASVQHSSPVLRCSQDQNTDFSCFWNVPHRVNNELIRKGGKLFSTLRRLPASRKNTRDSTRTASEILFASTQVFTRPRKPDSLASGMC